MEQSSEPEYAVRLSQIPIFRATDSIAANYLVLLEGASRH
jgi:hypothetical protein